MHRFYLVTELNTLTQCIVHCLFVGVSSSECVFGVRVLLYVLCVLSWSTSRIALTPIHIDVKCLARILFNSGCIASALRDY